MRKPSAPPIDPTRRRSRRVLADEARNADLQRVAAVGERVPPVLSRGRRERPRRRRLRRRAEPRVPDHELAHVSPRIGPRRRPISLRDRPEQAKDEQKGKEKPHPHERRSYDPTGRDAPLAAPEPRRLWAGGQRRGEGRSGLVGRPAIVGAGGIPGQVDGEHRRHGRVGVLPVLLRRVADHAVAVRVRLDVERRADRSPAVPGPRSSSPPRSRRSCCRSPCSTRPGFRRSPSAGFRSRRNVRRRCPRARRRCSSLLFRNTRLWSITLSEFDFTSRIRQRRRRGSRRCCRKRGCGRRGSRAVLELEAADVGLSRRCGPRARAKDCPM